MTREEREAIQARIARLLRYWDERGTQGARGDLYQRDMETVYRLEKRLDEEDDT